MDLQGTYFPNMSLHKATPRDRLFGEFGAPGNESSIFPGISIWPHGGVIWASRGSWEVGRCENYRAGKNPTGPTRTQNGLKWAFLREEQMVNIQWVKIMVWWKLILEKFRLEVIEVYYYGKHQPSDEK